MLVKCIELLAYENDADVAIDRFLETVGAFYAADRAYIFEYDFEKNCANNTYEWCKANVSSEKENLQQLPITLLDDWGSKFQEDGWFYINSVDADYSHDSSEYHILNQQGIQSVAVAPFVQDGRITGFLGVDNPSATPGTGRCCAQSPPLSLMSSRSGGCSSTWSTPATGIS